MKDGCTLPGWPLMLRRDYAAAYVGLSVSLFDNAVREGSLPPPVALVGSVKAWHRRDLEAWVEDRRQVSGVAANPWDCA